MADSNSQHAKSLLLIDDTQGQLDLISYLLRDNYNIHQALSGRQGIEKINRGFIPDLITLDIRMPDLDGYEVCRLLKSDSKSQDIPIIFISGAESLEERLLAYDAGGDDYIIKPISAQELTRKIRRLIASREKHYELNHRAAQAMDTAMVAMTNAGELGVVLEYLRSTFGCNTLADLSKETLSALDSFQLNAVTSLKTDLSQEEFSNDGTPTPLELSIIEKLKDKERFYDFGKRTLISFPHISILIKNMPLENPDFYGRIKDHVALLMEGAEERLRALSIDEKVRYKQASMEELIQTAETALRDLNGEFNTFHKECIHVLDSVTDNIESCLEDLDLTDSQEEFLLNVTRKALGKINTTYNSGIEFEKALELVVSDLNQVIHSDWRSAS